MWKVEQILENARNDKKGDIETYKYYITLLKQSDVVLNNKKYYSALRELTEILGMEDLNVNNK